MTKGEMIEQVYLKLADGRPSTDLNIHHADIESYMGAAVAKVLKDEIRLEEDREIRKARLNRMSYVGSPNNEYLCTYTLEPQFDEVRRLKYITIEGGLQRITSNNGIEEVGPVNGDPFVMVQSRSETIGIEFLPQTYYWFECDGDTNEDRIYFQNFPVPGCKVIARVILDFTSLSADSTAPVPSHLIVDVLDLVAYWLTDRLMNGDTKNSGVDEQVR